MGPGGFHQLIRSYDMHSTRLSAFLPWSCCLIYPRLSATRLLPISLTMASKRKKSNMSLMPPETATDVHSVSGGPSDAPRRSGRLLDRDGQGLRPQPAEDLEPNSRAESGQAKAKRSRFTGKNGAEVAVTGLREMENQFRNEVKRQQMAVKESHVRVKREYAAPMPRVIKSQPDTLSAEKEVAAMKRRRPNGMQGIIYAELDGEEESREPPDEEKAEFAVEENDINVVKHEGARPPPINSEYLPLPWKGRLGYVNYACHHG